MAGFVNIRPIQSATATNRKCKLKVERPAQDRTVGVHRNESFSTVWSNAACSSIYDDVQCKKEEDHSMQYLSSLTDKQSELCFRDARLRRLGPCVAEEYVPSAHQSEFVRYIFDEEDDRPCKLSGYLHSIPESTKEAYGERNMVDNSPSRRPTPEKLQRRAASPSSRLTNLFTRLKLPGSRGTEESKMKTASSPTRNSSPYSMNDRKVYNETPSLLREGRTESPRSKKFSWLSRGSPSSSPAKTRVDRGASPRRLISSICRSMNSPRAADLVMEDDALARRDRQARFRDAVPNGSIEERVEKSFLYKSMKEESQPTGGNSNRAKNSYLQVFKLPLLGKKSKEQKKGAEVREGEAVNKYNNSTVEKSSIEAVLKFDRKCEGHSPQIKEVGRSSEEYESDSSSDLFEIEILSSSSERRESSSTLE